MSIELTKIAIHYILKRESLENHQLFPLQPILDLLTTFPTVVNNIVHFFLKFSSIFYCNVYVSFMSYTTCAKKNPHVPCIKVYFLNGTLKYIWTFLRSGWTITKYSYFALYTALQIEVLLSVVISYNLPVM